MTGAVKSSIGLGYLLSRESATRCVCRWRQIRWKK